MKICAACSQALPKDKFSKKQWQLKGCRRCKECIAANREVALAGESALGACNDEPLLSHADGEEAPQCTDEYLFKQPPPRDECPICMLPQPLDEGETNYQACCGKVVCCGCICAVEPGKDGRIHCPFCRSPAHTSDREAIERVKKRIEADDAEAIHQLGCYSDRGEMGLQQNKGKATKLWLRAGELGHAGAYFCIGTAYDNGEGVERDEKKAKYYYELATMGGDVPARHNLGCIEEEAGNMSRAVKHWMIGAGAVFDDSLKEIRECFLYGHATKDDFEKALRAHKDAKDETKSEQRKAAAAARGLK